MTSYIKSCESIQFLYDIITAGFCQSMVYVMRSLRNCLIQVWCKKSFASWKNNIVERCFLDVFYRLDFFLFIVFVFMTSLFMVSEVSIVTLGWVWFFFKALIVKKRLKFRYEEKKRMKNKFKFCIIKTFSFKKYQKVTILLYYTKNIF